MVIDKMCLRGEIGDMNPCCVNYLLSLYLATNWIWPWTSNLTTQGLSFFFFEVMKWYHVRILKLRYIDVQAFHDPLPEVLSNFLFMCICVFSGTEFSEDKWPYRIL